MCWSVKTNQETVDEPWIPDLQQLTAMSLDSSYNATDIPMSGNTTDEYTLQCRYPAVPCTAARDAKFCRNGGICCYNDIDKFCVCDLLFTGQRCTEPRTHEVISAASSGVWSWVIVGVIVALVCLIVIPVVVYFRKKKIRMDRQMNTDNLLKGKPTPA